MTSPPYEKSTFKLYNKVFFARLLDLLHGTKESRDTLKQRIEELLGTGKYYGQGFTFKVFFHSENVIRELIRDIIIEKIPHIHLDAIKLIFEQSEFWSGCGFDFYDGVLKNSIEKSDRLLLNILPRKVAEELKLNGKTEPVHIESATVLFTDFKGFTQLAEKMSPQELIYELDYCFSYFDAVMDQYGLEKIKTIGDSYMCAGGIPEKNNTHAIDAVLAAMEINNFMQVFKLQRKSLSLPCWEIRIGIHTGPLVAGVIGEKKFTYDVWGDTVNTASRIESSGIAGRINISSETYKHVKDYFQCEYRGPIEAKNKGQIEMYFINGIRPELSENQEGRIPTPAFHKKRKAAGESDENK